MIDLLEIIKQYTISGEIDYSTRLLTLKVLGFTFKDIPVAWLAHEVNRPQVLSELVSKCFTIRQVNWMSYDGEMPEYAIRSLNELDVELNTILKEITDSKSPFANSIQEPVLAWQRAAKATRKNIEFDLPAKLPHYVNDPHEPRENHLDDYVDGGGPALLRGYLGAYRTRIYPLIAAFIELLDEQSPVRKDAEHYLNLGVANMAARTDYKFNPRVAYAAANWSLQDDATSAK